MTLTVLCLLVVVPGRAQNSIQLLNHLSLGITDLQGNLNSLGLLEITIEEAKQGHDWNPFKRWARTLA